MNPGTGGISNQVDPNLDPELAMALRISLEEEKERRQKEKEEEDVFFLRFSLFFIILYLFNNLDFLICFDFFFK